MNTVMQDARYAIRMLARTPGFTLVAVLTLALGIGANTAIFTVVNALLLRPLPYAEPGRLVMVWQDHRARGGPADEWASPGNYVDWSRERSLFRNVAAIGGWRPTLTGGAEPEPIPGEQVTHEYFEVLGTMPALGRTFRPEDDVPNAPRVAVIGDGLWKRRFGGDRAIVGRVISVLPLGGDSDTNFQIEGRPLPASPSDTPVTWYRQVTASYFDTMGMTIRGGRGFEPREAAPSVIVNESMAKKYFPGEDPLGRRLRFGDNSPWLTIVGVVADAKVRGAREAARIETFVPYWQLPEPGMNIVLKTAGDPALLAAPLKKAVASLDRNVPVQGITTLAEIVGESIEQPRFFAMLSAAFALLALVLAAIGIYGVMAYVVAQRTTEIGVRMALGATSGEVFRLVIGDGLRLTGLGVALGIVGSIFVARWLATLLFGVTPGDPVTLAATAGLLLVVAALACFLPARRATRVDPMVALRAE